MLEHFINKIHIIDPDIMVAHNLCSGVLENIQARVQHFRISHWSRLGRLKRTTAPKVKND
jgi:DNA polymerase alpha subunit A